MDRLQLHVQRAVVLDAILPNNVIVAK
jgi:hypothetical protein